MVQWLGLHTFTAEGPRLIPGQGTKMPQVTWCSQKKINSKIKLVIYNKAKEISSREDVEEGKSEWGIDEVRLDINGY